LLVLTSKVAEEIRCIPTVYRRNNFEDNTVGNEKRIAGKNNKVYSADPYLCMGRFINIT